MPDDEPIERSQSHKSNIQHNCSYALVHLPFGVFGQDNDMRLHTVNWNISPKINRFRWNTEIEAELSSHRKKMEDLKKSNCYLVIEQQYIILLQKKIAGISIISASLSLTTNNWKYICCKFMYKYNHWQWEITDSKRIRKYLTKKKYTDK